MSKASPDTTTLAGVIGIGSPTPASFRFERANPALQSDKGVFRLKMSNDFCHSPALRSARRLAAAARTISSDSRGDWSKKPSGHESKEPNLFGRSSSNDVDPFSRFA